MSLRIQDAVEEPLQLRGDLGKRVRADRYDAVPAGTHRQPALPQCARLSGLGAVLVEVERPDVRLHPEVVDVRRRAAIGACTEGGRGELALRGRPHLTVAQGGVQCGHHGDSRLDADLSGCHGFAHRRILRRQPIAVERARLTHRTRGAHQVAGAPTGGARGALYELVHRAAPVASGRTVGVGRGVRSLLQLGDRGDHDRLSLPHDLSRVGENREHIRVVGLAERARTVEVFDGTRERGRRPRERVGGVRHASIIPAGTDIPFPK
ncbi:hypothetical protein ABC304_05490 [Microbacterium sp. 1P10UB]